MSESSVWSAGLSRRERADDLLRAGAYFAIGLLLLLVVPEVGAGWRPGLPATPLWVDVAVLAAACVAQTQRRAHPLSALLAAGAVMLSGPLLGESHIGVLLVFADVLYSAVLFGSARVSRTVSVGAGVLVAVFALVILVSDGGKAAVVVVLNLSALAIPVMWGREVRHHREQARAERGRAEQAGRVAELDRTAAVAAERARMARDLHDVIAGQLSAIAIQSAAALNLPDPDPTTLRRVLAAVRGNSVDSLDEMRAMIGLLRADGAAAAEPLTAPAGLGRLDTLLDAGRASGLQITVADRRPPDAAVPAAVDLAAYRIVQESLTNAAKHAPGSAVRLGLHQYRHELLVEVENALVPGATPGGGTGTGLLGLRERAGAVGGQVEAGARGGTWTVRAVLPATAPAGAVR